MINAQHSQYMGTSRQSIARSKALPERPRLSAEGVAVRGSSVHPNRSVRVPSGRNVPIRRAAPRLRAWVASALTVICLVGESPATAAREQPDPEDVVERADRIRFPASPFQVDVRITTSRQGGAPDVREYRVLSRGNDNTLVMSTAPPAERGQILLMKARDLWAFLPKVAQPVRLPVSAKLTGQVSNGDLARANLAGDYHARLLRTESQGGQEQFVLDLTAVDRGVTYGKVRYWVETETFRPTRAEFYSLSGRLLKTCHYGKYEPLGGEVRPTRLVIENALRRGEKSQLDYYGMQLRDLPEEVFTKEYLKRLQ